MSVSKIVAAAASGVGGAGLDVDEVFSTTLYSGTNANQTITNGIDLSGEGGLVWTKARDYGVGHGLVDTVRGNTKYLEANGADAEATTSVGITAFNSTGYNLGADDTWKFNVSNSYVSEYVSWTFRKAPKFFDVVTYTGNSTAGRTVSHNLGSVPGMMVVKKTNASTAWNIYHRSLGATKYLLFDTSDAGTQTARWNDTAPTSTQFTVGTAGGTNDNGATYVAYLFAHNNNDGGFGPSGDQDAIVCSSYTGGTTGTEVNVGFEPQFVMIKRASDTGDWMVFDAMRGVVSDPYPNLDNTLFWNLSNAERTNTGYIGFTPTGFIHQGGSGDTNTNGDTYIYMAIRRGPLAAPTDATKVFAVQDGRGASKLYTAGFPVDAFLQGNKNGDNWQFHSRLTRGKVLATDTAAAETADTFYYFDDQTGIVKSSGGGSALSILVAYMWKRAPSYFDVVGFSGTGTAGLTVNHNLGVAPEMTWVKRRDSATNWRVNVAAIGTDGQNSPSLRLNMSNAAEDDNGSYFGNNNSGGYAAPTSSVLTFGGHGDVNASGGSYIAYLFATLPGVSKVGSFSHTNGGGDTNVDCGFSSGVRLVICKRTSGTGSWYIFNSVRGIVSGNDPHLELNSVGSEVTGSDVIDPLSSGFTITSGFLSSGTYIFYAIA